MFDVYRQQLSADLVNKGKDPGSVFSDSVAVGLTGSFFLFQVQ
jgi:hypothetical protein